MSNPESNMSAMTTTPATSGSNTMTQTVTPPQPALRLAATSGTLRLRAEPAERRHIQWAEDVVDNEGLGRKSSKVCCIFHKAREVGESSDESSSDSSSDDDSDSEPDNSTARPVGGSKKGGKRGRRPRQHDHDHKNGDDCGNTGPAEGQPRRRPSPNAYEKMPKQKK